MRLVIFDFDATLTVRDTMRPFAKYVAARRGIRYRLACLWLLLAGCRLGIVGDKALKESYLTLFLKGMDYSEAESLAGSFHEQGLGNLLNPVIFGSLKRHVEAGDTVYIVSANFDFFLAALVKKWGVTGVIATETEKDGKRLTGKIMGTTCKGAHKVSRVTGFFGREALKEAIAYGDQEDRGLLSVVRDGILVGERDGAIAERIHKA